MSELSSRHLLGLRDTPAADIRKILDTAASFKDVLGRKIKKVPSLRGVTVVNLFFENSTRTRISFELAEKRLSADTVNFSSSSSSLKKGESISDTLRNIEAMKVDAVVVRHGGTGVPSYLSRNSDAVIINAGDGANEHPTQALLDMFSMEDVLGSLEGKKVAIVGDIRHSRVARSNAWALPRMGAEVTLCGPPTLLPSYPEDLDVRCTDKLEEALAGADVVMALRLQKERQQAGRLSSEREYREFYGIRSERLDRFCPEALVMHPGPVNRDLELDSDLMDGKRSVILEQVTNGVAVRMAVLYLLCGGDAS